MSKEINTTNVTIDLESATPTVRPMPAMKDAIITACECGNKHAVTAVEAAMSGAESKDFSRWTGYVDSLRLASIDYGKVVENKSATDEEIKLAQGRVWTKWQDALSIGVDEFHQNMFMREQDADTMRVYAYNMATMNIDGVGTVSVVTPRGVFRKMVETFVGLRIRANEALCDADRDIIAAVLSAKKTIAKMTERLNGRNTEDTHEAGLNEVYASLQKSLKDSLKLLDTFGITEEDAKVNPAVVNLMSDISRTESDISKAKKAIADSEKVLEQKQEQYSRIVATINKIERVR